MGTRYDIGDSVRKKESQGIYGEVVDIKNPESNSPDYIEDRIGLDDYDFMELMEKTGSTKMQTVSYEVEQ